MQCLSDLDTSLESNGDGQFGRRPTSLPRCSSCIGKIGHLVRWVGDLSSIYVMVLNMTNPGEGLILKCFSKSSWSLHQDNATSPHICMTSDNICMTEKTLKKWRKFEQLFFLSEKFWTFRLESLNLPLKPLLIISQIINNVWNPRLHHEPSLDDGEHPREAIRLWPGLHLLQVLRQRVGILRPEEHLYAWQELRV